MIDFTQEQLDERFASMPAPVQEALASAETGEQLRRIGTRHNLHIDQLGILNDVTGLVILGFVERSDYLPTLTEELGIPTEVAEAILIDVNTEILEPMRASLGGPKESAVEESLNPAKAESAEEEDEEMAMHLPTRAELLKEIENPAPAAERKEPRMTQKAPGDTFMKEQEGGALPAQEREPRHENIVEKKMIDTTVLKEARSEETPSDTAPSPSPKTPLDPYREPVE